MIKMEISLFIKIIFSQVQGSTFTVKDKEGIEELKSSLQMLIFPSNYQFGSKFCIRPEEADAFLVNTAVRGREWNPPAGKP